MSCKTLSLPDIRQRRQYTTCSTLDAAILSTLYRSNIHLRYPRAYINNAATATFALEHLVVQCPRTRDATVYSQLSLHLSGLTTSLYERLQATLQHQVGKSQI